MWRTESCTWVTALQMTSGQGNRNTHISNSQESFVKEQDHPEEEEKHAKAC